MDVPFEQRASDKHTAGGFVRILCMYILIIFVTYVCIYFK